MQGLLLDSKNTIIIYFQKPLNRYMHTEFIDQVDQGKQDGFYNMKLWEVISFYSTYHNYKN